MAWKSRWKGGSSFLPQRSEQARASLDLVDHEPSDFEPQSDSVEFKGSLCGFVLRLSCRRTGVFRRLAEMWMEIG